MARDVEERRAAAVRAWGLRDVVVLPEESVALVCAAAGAILKVNPRGHREDAQVASEPAALRFWSATGAAVEVLDTRDDGFTLLLERLGAPPSVPRDELLVLLGGLAARLHAAGPAPASFTHVGEFLRGLPAELAAPRADDVLIHGDLHAGNALRAGDGWKVIDPKGLRGDRHADVWALLDPDAPVATTERVALYARAAGLDPERARAWTRARALAEIPDAGGAWAERLRRTAEALTP